MRCVDLSGLRFGKLTVLRRASSTGDRVSWECICDCGNNNTVRSSNLRCGLVRSCGCLQRQATSVANATHRRSHTKEHNTWCWMKDRCSNPKNKSYPRYGGKGITVSDRWQSSFEAFFEDMGLCPGPRYSIDRIDNDGNYEPGNCRWATRREQSLNRGAYNHRITAFGQTKTQSEWARLLGTTDSHVRVSLKRGKTVEWLAARRGIGIAEPREAA
jgi:hypothetical protein